MALNQEQEQKFAAVRAARDEKIPVDWRLNASILSTLPKNVKPIFESCGILSSKELEITNVRDATALLEKLHSATWSAEEVTVAFCKRAAIAQQLINCLMDIDFEGGIKRARELDDHLRQTGKVVGPLHGLPISIKDQNEVKGMHCTLGFAAWVDRISERDSMSVHMLRESGAVFYVKTTMPQTGMALETVSNLWGRTLNPSNTALTCGGSSGGEGALASCFGCPIAIATDIGGSIRAPASFNGMYAIKPTSRRCSYMGNLKAIQGQIAIPSAIGPVGRSVRDLELILQAWSDKEPWLTDPTVVEKPWSSAESPKKLTLGVMWWDEVVMPHPPVQRALRTTVDKLKMAGHEAVVDYKPYKHRESWDITLPLYFPTAGAEMFRLLEEGGEPMITAPAKMLRGTKQLSVPELLQYQAAQANYQNEYLAHLNATAKMTSTGKPVDALLTPAFASASYPHDFLPWWGYFCVWNLLNYPTTIIPVTSVDKSIDVKDLNYKPVNSFDSANYDIYDPELFDGAPVCLQLIGRPLAEEKLIAVTRVVDEVVNSTLSAARTRFTNRNPKSLALHQNAADYLPGGNTRSLLHTFPFPISLARGRNYTVTDEDGHVYLDLVGELTVALYGYSHPTIQAALINVVHNVGLNLGGTIAQEAQHAALLCKRFNLQRIRFTNSGIEANLHALGAARRFTGKNRVVVFHGGYHGAVLSFGDGGCAENNVDRQDWIIARYNDLEDAREKIQLPGVAAVIIEAMQGAGECIPAREEFVKSAPEAAKKVSAVFPPPQNCLL
ncbi:uncharacterized protein Z518_10113 [Rhinocladiella mackenziei CBS 650.93]|uniref:Amidase domain-containing protein n=1 Tax=Rhinocladiella mackenziei CBS 650.93 TaxID=1442369 RepID=A0A0D2FGE7_9EURO|nr:uncharacterized protein Z518_10113 [Rhinocladiella mackenziei CBS 650.93]KIX01047.1 hypothetical protein Z518_10113 [Rhinocladiella mackenziei CBS 650.93]